MRKDKSQGMFLTVVFGVLGLTVLILAWLWPISTSDRIMAILLGSAGLFVAIVRIPMLRRSPRKPDNEQVTVDVACEEKP